jgi:hypothetical protein
MSAHEGNPVLGLLAIAPSGGVLNGDPTCGAEAQAMDFPLLDSLDENSCYTKACRTAPPRRLGMPALWKAATPGDPPPPSRAPRGLP